jgi:O-antigen/teichoic acid export membrane protein
MNGDVEREEPPASLGARTASAAQWRLGGAVISAAAQFFVGAILARLLLPADFGLVALAFVVLGLANLFGDLGVGSVIVQQREISPQHLRVAFSVSIALGTLLSIGLAAAAPLLSLAMASPQLTPVLQALAFTFFLRGISVVAGALLRRRLEYRKLFYIEFTTYVFGYSAIGMWLAFAGAGVWSLVAGGIAQTVLSTILLIALAPHPTAPLFDRNLLRTMLRAGAGFSLNGCASYLALNADKLLMGRFIGAAGLGLYSRAYSLMNLPLTYTASIMSGVLFPAFSQVQTDTARLRRGYLLASRLTALTAAPIMAGMIVAASPLVRGIYGPNWEGAILPLQILCVAGYFRALYHLGGAIAHGTGNVYRELRAQIEYALMVITGSLAGLHAGVVGVAVGVAIAIVYMYFRMAFLSLNICRARWIEYLSVQKTGIALGTLVAAVAILARCAMESLGSSALLIAVTLVLLCGFVWACSLSSILQQPNYEPVWAYIPGSLQPYLSILNRYSPVGWIKIRRS